MTKQSRDYLREFFSNEVKIINNPSAALQFMRNLCDALDAIEKELAKPTKTKEENVHKKTSLELMKAFSTLLKDTHK
jgi:hypothetical protein